MTSPKKPLVLALLSVAALSLSMACGGRAAGRGPQHPLLGHEVSVVSESFIDSENHYLSVVKVAASIYKPGTGHISKECSGVLVEERLVVTAAHCVCDERPPVTPESPGTTIVDKKARCATTVYVRFLTYDSQAALSSNDAEHIPADESDPYRGTVHIPEEFKIVYKEVEGLSGEVVKSTIFSNADIAAISLTDSVKEKVKYTPLATNQLARGEKVVLVGYGLPYLGDSIGRDRRFGENHVVAIKLDGTTFQVGKQNVEVAGTYTGEAPDARVSSGSYITTGDSGGPCFRVTRKRLEVVGIAKSVRVGTLKLSAYTSISRYMDWLQNIPKS
ncbi:MAG: trypsin-like serine protease [Myxococcaceae bacterium]|nr:trypsin-like serine protease [Myxococcaceae bacterium]